jgi:hypothetical protein
MITMEHVQTQVQVSPSTRERNDWGYFEPVYDWDKLWPEILKDIGNGSSLITAIKKPDYPTYDMVQKYMRSRPEIRRLYDDAIEIRADYLAETLIDISEQPIPEGLDGPYLSAWINQMKIRIETRKWTAAKLRPKQWGEKIDVSVTHTQISIVQALEQAEARLLDVTDIEPNDTKDYLTDDQPIKDDQTTKTIPNHQTL